MSGGVHGTAERPRRGLLGRLAGDVRANTLAMMAIALIPISALAGSAVDMARMYVVKARLQQACDAGVLAGRKFMVEGSSSTTLDSNAITQAQTFFANNFSSGYMNTATFNATTNPYPFLPSKTSDSQVAGTARIVLPMSVMKMFGVADQTIAVTCQARKDVADSDVMFVLDTTGSMACLTSDDQNTCDSYASNSANVVKNSDGRYSVTEKNNSRIAGLRTAVLNFYNTIAGYQAANPAMHFRYGFVPYSATTNVGALLPRSYMAPSTWTYQSRQFLSSASNGNASSTTTTGITQAACNARAGQSAWTANVATGTSSSTVGSYTASATTVSSWTASGNSGNGSCVTSTQPIIATLRYSARSLDVTSYLNNFYNNGPAVANPSAIDGDTSIWNGCVEERGGSTTATTFSASSPPLDLDVDTVPSSSTPNSYWGPMWPDAVFVRSNSSSTQEDSTAYRDALTRYQYGTYFNTYQFAHLFNEIPCPRAAQRLTTMSQSDVSNYLSASNGFRPFGVTYHDTGMTWGTRLLSPTGMFASDTAAWTGHNPPNRYIIFLTDGLMETDEYAYTTHGIEQFDNRVGSNGNNGTLNSLHNSRFATACTIAKNHNIKVFVISYAQALSAQLTACASPNSAYSAADSTALNTAFQSIAQQVAMLRISQ